VRESKAEAERRKAVALADQRELDYRIKAGKHVEREAAARAIFLAHRAGRDGVMSMGERVADKIALAVGEADPGTNVALLVRRIIEVEARRVAGEMVRAIPAALRTSALGELSP
jgi:hypothetical protein